MPRRGTYLFKRKNSNNCWLRFQYTGSLAGGEGKTKFEKSLGTPDRDLAEILASDLIKEHRKKILIRRNDFKQKKADIRFRYDPGKLHQLKDGTSVFATESTITYFDSNGNMTKTEDNFKINLVPTSFTEQEEIIVFGRSQRSSREDDVLENWIKRRSINHHLASEARRTLECFRKMVGNKPFDKCTKEDGRNLADFLLSNGNSSSTVLKKVGHLCAAVNLAISDGILKVNPFSRVVPKLKDSIRRLPLSNQDMHLASENLYRLRDSDKTLWILLATTGMRLDEAFQINEDYVEEGLRYVVVGTKTTTSLRRIPLSDEVLPLLPLRITEPLFSDGSKASGKRLSRFLRSLKIGHDSAKDTGDRRKVVHSLRHRAKDRLRIARCPLDVQYEILGHEVRTVASGYGAGYPITELKRWIDEIGY